MNIQLITALNANDWPEGRREVAVVGDAITLRSSVALTCTLPRRPSASAAAFSSQSLTLDAPGFYRLQAVNGLDVRVLELVVFEAAALSWPGLAVYPANSSGSAAASPGAPRAEVDKRRILRGIVNDSRCTEASVGVALEIANAKCRGLNPALFGRPNDGGLNLAEFGA